MEQAGIPQEGWIQAAFVCLFIIFAGGVLAFFNRLLHTVLEHMSTRDAEMKEFIRGQSVSQQDGLKELVSSLREIVSDFADHQNALVRHEGELGRQIDKLAGVMGGAKRDGTRRRAKPGSGADVPGSDPGANGSVGSASVVDVAAYASQDVHTVDA